MIYWTGVQQRLQKLVVPAAAAILAVSLAVAPSASMAAPNAAIVVDAKTGKTLYSSNADARRYPASLTKMMTLYMLFEAIDSGQTGLNSRIRFSARAAGQAPSKLGLKKGQTIRVKDAILALVTKSANDVATAVGEHIAGTESAFAKRMTKKARAMGMSKTTFRNASGLPNKAQVTTARDMAILGRAMRDHYPKYYAYFKTPSFSYKGKRYSNHNKLLGRVAGVDGIKTGFTRASGFNLVTSLRKDGRYVVAVVLGGDTGKQRDNRMAGLLKKYVPKATRGSRKAAMIPGGPNSISMTFVPASEYPLPRLRPTTGAVIGTTEVTANLAGANSLFAARAVGQGDATPADEIEIAARPPASQSGWKIQLAATPTQASAEDVLNQALSRGAEVLADATPYTEPVKKSGATLYRARFSGFQNKEAARSACAAMKKREFRCLAIQ